MIGIYKITNLKSGKVYIGQSKDIHRRFREYKYRSGKVNTPIHKAICKHGVESFVFDVVEECLESALDSLEKEYIAKYGCNIKSNGYNVTDGGKGYNGKFTDSHRESMSESKRGEKNPNFGKSPSDETLRKQVESMKKVVRTDEWKQNISKALKGRVIDEEWRDKIRRTLTGFKHSDETKLKISIKSTGRLHTDEAKRKISIAKSKKVYQYGMDCTLIAEYESLEQAEKETGVFKSNICRCCQKQRRSAGGYIWSYEVIQ
jgi:group I intron endonuclease